MASEESQVMQQVLKEIRILRLEVLFFFGEREREIDSMKPCGRGDVLLLDSCSLVPCSMLYINGM